MPHKPVDVKYGGDYIIEECSVCGKRRMVVMHKNRSRPTAWSTKEEDAWMWKE